jgi:hypothetical protein
VHRGGRGRAGIDRVVKAVGILLPTSADVARLAGESLGRTGTTDVVDAIVAAEALAALPAVILTSDARDLTRLIEGPQARRVVVIGV